MTEIEKLEFKNLSLECENRYLKSLQIKTNCKKTFKESLKDFFAKPSKTKIGLVVDVDNWAFANIANNFKKHLSDYDVFILPMSLIDSNFRLMWIMLKEYKIVHFFCRGVPLSIKNPALKEEVEKYGDTFDNFYETFIKGKIITTCVYDHLFLDSDFDFTQYLCSEVPMYYVSSNILWDIYNDLDIKYKPSTVITDGVDLELFYPKNIDRIGEKHTIKIGWVGNSQWNKGIDHKGINTIIKPAVDILKKQGYDIELLTSDKIDKHIPINEMVNYYEKIDIYICASLNEGTPNPVLEAMACGIPVISTNVGIVKDVFGPIQQQFILKERSSECLAEAIKKMLDNDNVMKKCSTENMESIKKWDWKYKTHDFENFIKNAVKKDYKL